MDSTYSLSDVKEVSGITDISSFSNWVNSNDISREGKNE